MNKFWLFSFHVRVFFLTVCIDLCFSFSLQRPVLSPRSTTMPFFARKDFFPSPHVSLVLPSYAELRAIALAAIDSLNPSFGSSNIDLAIIAYIDDLVSDA